MGELRYRLIRGFVDESGKTQTEVIPWDYYDRWTYRRVAGVQGVSGVLEPPCGWTRKPGQRVKYVTDK